MDESHRHEQPPEGRDPAGQDPQAARPLRGGPTVVVAAGEDARASGPARGVCVRCDYSLAGVVASTCPECGYDNSLEMLARLEREVAKRRARWAVLLGAGPLMWLLVLLAGFAGDEGLINKVLMVGLFAAPAVMALGLAGMVGVRRRRLGRGVLGLADVFVGMLMLVVFFACSCPVSAWVGGMASALAQQVRGGR